MDKTVETLHAPHGTTITPVLSQTKESKHKLTMLIEFDMSQGSDEFGRFCGALLAGGFEDVVLGMARELLAEARRRNLSLPSLEEALGKPCDSTLKE